MYLRYAALGDSSTYGIGDRVPGGWRGWARLLATGMEAHHPVSFCNLATPGSTTADVLRDQLGPALDHGPDVASLVVGINDAMRSTWDARRVRDDLMTAADALHDAGALLLTARFHDHGRVFGLPERLRRPLHARIEAVNAAQDEVHRTFGSLRLDLADWPQVRDRRFWSVDRLHPSELGHRALAHAYGRLLLERGVDLELPALEASGGLAPTPADNARWLLTEVVPWIGRRARDLGPWAAQLAWADTVARRQGTPVSAIEDPGEMVGPSR